MKEIEKKKIVIYNNELIHFPRNLERTIQFYYTNYLSFFMHYIFHAILKYITWYFYACNIIFQFCFNRVYNYKTKEPFLPGNFPTESHICFLSFFPLFPLCKITRKGWKQNFEGKELWIKNARANSPPRLLSKELKEGREVCTQVWTACTYGPPAKREPTPVTHTNHDQWFTVYGQQVDPKWGFIRAFVTPWY